MVILRQVPPAQGVLEVVVPLLEHEPLGAEARAAVDGLLVGCEVRSSTATADPMSWPDEKSGPTPPRITTRTSSSFSAGAEGVVELDEQAPVLRVAGVGPVQEDADDPALVVLLVLQEIVVRHGPVPLFVGVVDPRRGRTPGRGPPVGEQNAIPSRRGATNPHGGRPAAPLPRRPDVPLPRRPDPPLPRRSAHSPARRPASPPARPPAPPPVRSLAGPTCGAGPAVDWPRLR